MNPQMGKSMYGGSNSSDSQVEDPTTDGQDSTEDHVELHHGGHPDGNPPPHEGTKYHTIHGADVRNHDDYESANEHMKECMGESGDDSGMQDSGGESFA